MRRDVLEICGTEPTQGAVAKALEEIVGVKFATPFIENRVFDFDAGLGPFASRYADGSVLAIFYPVPRGIAMHGLVPAKDEGRATYRIAIGSDNKLLGVGGEVSVGTMGGHTPETKSVRLTEPRVSTLTLAYRPVIDVARINSKAIEAGMSLEECVLEGKGDFLIPGSFRRGESNVETPVDQVFQFNTLVLYTLTPEAYQTMRAATERAR